MGGKRRKAGMRERGVGRKGRRTKAKKGRTRTKTQTRAKMKQKAKRN